MTIWGWDVGNKETNTEKNKHGKFKCEKYAICMYEVSLLFACSLFIHKKSSKRMLIKSFLCSGIALHLMSHWYLHEQKIKFKSNWNWYDMMLEMFLTVITICFYVYCYFYVLCLLISVELRFFACWFFSIYRNF